ncbi:hypothetical protein BDZ89DRAFT_1037619 [Hymenopellis radicata]|nr:hypothetical protein BDZ89DRAFT_1037619 [Hymenopellis radicata]
MDSWDYYPSPSSTSSSTSPSPAPQPTCLPTTQLFGLAESSPVVRETRKRPPPAEDSDADDDDGDGEDDAPVRAGRPSRRPAPRAILYRRTSRACQNAKPGSSKTALRHFSHDSANARNLKLWKSELEAENKRLRSRKPIKKEEQVVDVNREVDKDDNPVMLALLCALPSLGLVRPSTPIQAVTFKSHLMPYLVHRGTAFASA